VTGVTIDRALVEETYRQVQERFCLALESFDGVSVFATDPWDRPGGGGGVTRVMTGEERIEKAAVSFSSVTGPTPPGLSDRLAIGAREFYATGVSIIVHPMNPHAPTFHANLRHLSTDRADAWFGGGADLTPWYLYEEDAREFHAALASVCRAHEVGDYQTWKQACDEYFYLPHRGEARGVGGLFFDDLRERGDEVLAFQADLAARLLEVYLLILGRRVDLPYTHAERAWQEVRRGRYAEFNLVWDRGTRFGLETSGRAESILASLPPRVRWTYDHVPEPGTAEERLVDLVRSPPRSWI